MIKLCSKCGKETTEFVPGYHQCKECIKKYKAELYQKQKANYKIKNSLYYKENKEVCLTAMKTYYNSNKDTIINQHREYRNQPDIKDKLKLYNYEYQVEYDKKNPGKHSERWRKRRAKQLGLNENYTEVDRQYTKDLFQHKCACCGSVHYLQIDHHLPLELGHVLTRSNAVLLCRSCNCSKGTKLPIEFYNSDTLKMIEERLKSVY